MDSLANPPSPPLPWGVGGDFVSLRDAAARRNLLLVESFILSVGAAFQPR